MFPQSSWKLLGFCRTEDKFGLIFLFLYMIICVRSRSCGCLVTWFCYWLIAKPGNKTAAVSWPNPYKGGLPVRHVFCRLQCTDRWFSRWLLPCNDIIMILVLFWSLPVFGCVTFKTAWWWDLLPEVLLIQHRLKSCKRLSYFIDPLCGKPACALAIQRTWAPSQYKDRLS